DRTDRREEGVLIQHPQLGPVTLDPHRWGLLHHDLLTTTSMTAPRTPACTRGSDATTPQHRRGRTGHYERTPEPCRQRRRWSFRWTLLCWVKAWVGLQESVELAGDVADQAASDLAVGLALSPSPLGIGAGRRVIAQ